jgi:hypothetical protein
MWMERQPGGIAMRHPRRSARLDREAAEAMAARALLFLAEDPGRLGRFLAETGLDPVSLRVRAGSPEVIGAALGHVMADESTLLAFTANAGLAPESLGEAAALLGIAGPWEST